jgi:integrase
VAGLRTKRDAENAIRRDLVPPWRGRSITSITKHDVVEVIEDIISRRGTPGGVCYAAHHSLAYAKKLFAWAAARNYGVENNPCDKIKPGELIGAKAKRKRVLTDDEIRLLWKVTGDITYPLGPLVRMLLVTGQRLREIAHGEWREVNLDEAVWTIPGSRMKNGDANEVPLSPLALDILNSLPRFQGGTFVFSSTGGRSAAFRSTSSGSTGQCCGPTAVRWACPRATTPCVGCSASRIAKLSRATTASSRSRSTIYEDQCAPG